MQTITTLAELDAKVAECEDARQVSDDALRRVFRSFRMDPPADMPRHPFSEEYSRYQLALYHRLAGKPYDVRNEVTSLEVEEAAKCPFPYNTGGTVTTADQYTAIGALLRRLDLAPGARVLEFGPGWGNTTLALALLGFQVTAIDIEKRFCDLVQKRQNARRFGRDNSCRLPMGRASRTALRRGDLL